MFKLFNRSLSLTIVSAVLLLVASIGFAQTPSAGPASDVRTTASTDVERKDSELVSKNDVTATKRADFSSFDREKSTAKTKAQTGASSDWEFAFAPYLYITGVSGTVAARGRTADVDVSFGDILKKFKIGFMGVLEAKKGKFLILNDIVWVKMSEERNTPGGLYSTGKIGVNQFTWTPEFGYRVAESKAGSIDLLAGIRFTSVENTLKFTTGTLPAFDVNARKTWAAPIVGAHGVMNVSPKVYLSALFDVGGGFGTRFTGQFYGGLGYRITPKVALVGGYRYLNNNFRDSEGFVFNTQMNGIIMGARFGF